jgi:uncharacterized alpha-E superfamily protein
LASEPEKQITLRTPEAQQVQENVGELPSRVVENLFWMGRYAERAESGLRLLRTVFVQLNKTEALPDVVCKSLLKAITDVTSTYPGFTRIDTDLLNNPEPEMISIILDQQRIGSVANNLIAMIKSAEQVKEQLSSDTQRIINNIGDELDALKINLKPEALSAPEEALAPLVTALLAFAGLMHESMIRGNGWHFMEMGRRMERALQIISGLRSMLTSKFEDIEQEVLVETALLNGEALISYRRRYQSGVNVENGLEMLLLNINNPRSLIFQIEELAMHFADLPGNKDTLSPENKFLLEATTALKLSDVKELAKANTGVRQDLDQILARVQYLIGSAAKAISQRYFDHAQGPQLLVKNSEWQDLL